jgi:hypothetical protein
MDSRRIQLPEGVIRVDRRGHRGPRFTTGKTEQRIRDEAHQKEVKCFDRASQEKDFEYDSRLEAEVQKTRSIVKLRDTLLGELARHENAHRGFCTSEVSDNEEQKESYERKRNEILKALEVLL